MVDEEILAKICNYADLGKFDTVLEIGAGTGNLTEKLAEKSRIVYAIESDGKLIPKLKKRLLDFDNVKIIHGSALKLEFPEFDKVVSNLPYSISRKITERLMKENFGLGILVYQKEFAEKLTARVGTQEYRFISALVQSRAEIEILGLIPPSAFEPKPMVYSAIVKIKPKFHPDEDYAKFLRNLFDHRNKKISFGNFNSHTSVCDKKIFKDKRPFELTPKELKELYRNLSC